MEDFDRGRRATALARRWQRAVFCGSGRKDDGSGSESPCGAKPTFDLSTPQPLFDKHLARPPGNAPFEYDLTADGKRFLVNTTGISSTSTPMLNVVVNWDAGLKK
jgi:hypothetical protein